MNYLLIIKAVYFRFQVNEFKAEFPDDADEQSASDEAISYSEQYKAGVSTLITKAETLIAQVKAAYANEAA